MIITNYIKYTLDFSLTNSRLNFSLILQSRQFTNSHGSFIFGPIDANLIYMATLTACSPIKLLNTSLENDDCIKSQSFYFSKSTQPPQNLSLLTFVLDPITNNSSLLAPPTIHLEWDLPEFPNSYMIAYTVLRRDLCFDEDDNASRCENEVVRSKGGVVCCDGLRYEEKYGYECCQGNYLPKPFNFSSVCCGGRFYEAIIDYQCCAGLYYVHVPFGQICCGNRPSGPNSTEIRYRQRL
jgi:hypothetical protein